MVALVIDPDAVQFNGVSSHACINVGNARNAAIAALLPARVGDIKRFVAHDEYTFLAIGFDDSATSS